LKSDISENDSKVFDNSFDKPHYRSVDSQISEYAVQKSVMEYNDFKSRSEYESGNSVLNNLQFTSKNNNKGEEYQEYPCDKKDDYINYLWRRGNENNRESQKTIDNSKKKLIKELNRFDNSSNNKINLSNMGTDNDNSVNKKNNNDNNNNNNSNQTNRDMINRDSVDSGAISYICSNNNTNISENNLDVGVTAEEIERFNKNKYKLNTNSSISKYNVDSYNLNSDVNTNQSGINFSKNNKKIDKNASSIDDISGK